MIQRIRNCSVIHLCPLSSLTRSGKLLNTSSQKHDLQNPRVPCPQISICNNASAIAIVA